MRIKEVGNRLQLTRYGGRIDGKSLDVKIGSVGTHCLPTVVDRELPPNSNEGIPLSLWKKLTIEEQEELTAKLNEIQHQIQRGGHMTAVSYLKKSAANIESVTPELAAELWEEMAALQKALKKAGYPKPHHADKTPQKAAGNVPDTLTAQLPLGD